MLEQKIAERVRHYYWEQDINCARTMLRCLAEAFSVRLEQQTVNAAIGLHGAGGFRAQCGLVEGALMFLGIYATLRNKTPKEIAGICRAFAEAFTAEYSSLRCYDLRPNGFNKEDPPHLCENLTARAIVFAQDFVRKTL